MLKNALYFTGLSIAVVFVGAVVFRVLQNRAGLDPVGAVAGVFGVRAPQTSVTTTAEVTDGV